MPTIDTDAELAASCVALGSDLEPLDPVFSPNYCQIEGVKHAGKARRGDGNDLTGECYFSSDFIKYVYIFKMLLIFFCPKQRIQRSC